MDFKRGLILIVNQLTHTQLKNNVNYSEIFNAF